MKGLANLVILFSFIYFCSALTPVTIQYSEARCTRSLNPYDPLHEFLPCVKPGASFWVAVTFNASPDLLTNVKINQNETLCAPNCISGLSNLSVGSFTADISKTINLTLSAPAVPGLYQPLVDVTSNDIEVDNFYLRIEVTCSNGKFCDGVERWVNGECVVGTNPCDDGFACTIDYCNETAALCSHTPSGSNCPTCGNCDKTCEEEGTVCGLNNCGENCGSCNAPGDTCLPDFGCMNSSLVVGTCQNPIVLFPDGFTLGLNTVTGTTADGPNILAPLCAQYSLAPEKIYSLTLNASYYADIRVYGEFDVVFSAFIVNTCGPGIYQSCSDDATPPGMLGARLVFKLNPGTYYFLVDGYSSQEFGSFTMEFRFSQTCLPSCSGKFCGNDLCGGDCGPCGEGLACSSANTCIPDPCISACNVTRFCGTGECGEECGTCPSGEMCIQSTGQCVPVPTCNHLVPVCTPECGSGEFCGSDCKCYALDYPLPDLVITKDYVESTIYFTTETFAESHCAIVEKCLSGPGTHRLLRFGVEALNQGKGEIVGRNPVDNPNLYQWSPCHAHYHFQQFSEYFLLSADGAVVKEGRKQAYCLRDSFRLLKSPAIECKSTHDCSNQGISAGWADVYGPTLDCQWLEVDDVVPGDYILFLTLNPARIIPEASFENNYVYLPLTITAKDLGLNETTPITPIAPPTTPISAAVPQVQPAPTPVSTPVKVTSQGLVLRSTALLHALVALLLFSM